MFILIIYSGDKKEKKPIWSLRRMPYYFLHHINCYWIGILLWTSINFFFRDRIFLAALHTKILNFFYCLNRGPLVELFLVLHLPFFSIMMTRKKKNFTFEYVWLSFFNVREVERICDTVLPLSTYIHKRYSLLK